MEERVDLHLHSNLSDGEYHPAQVVKLAAEIEVKYIAFADHDRFEAIKEAMPIGKRLRVDVIPATEISIRDNPKKSQYEIHLLAYFINIYNSLLRSLLGRNIVARERAGRKHFEKIRQEYELRDLNWREFRAKYIGKPVYKPMIVDYILDGRPDLDKTELYKKMTPVCERLTADMRTAISVIHNAQGLAFLAHPLRYTRRGLEKLEVFLDYFKSIGGDGIETIYPYHLMPDIVERFREGLESNVAKIDEYATANRMLRCGGSDSHFRAGTPPMGSVIVPAEFVEDMKKALRDKYNRIVV